MNEKKLKKMGIEKRRETVMNKDDLIPINENGRQTLLNSELEEIEEKCGD